MTLTPLDRWVEVHVGEPTASIRTPVDVVLPCLDAADALPAVLAGLPSGWRAVVVDNGSRDGSAEVARAHGAVVVEDPLRGYGSACAVGLAAATSDIVAVCDTDGSLDLADLPRVVAPVAMGVVDLALGRRVPRTGSAWPASARLANRYLARQVRRRTGTALTDLGPMRAARREALLGLGARSPRSGYPVETVLLAARAGWRIAEVPVPYRPRIGGSTATGTFRGAVTAIAEMRRTLREVGA